MSCPSPETLALWMDDGSVADATGRHVRDCTACGELVRELEADGALLREEGDLPEAAYADVRGHVLAHISSGNRKRYAWPAAAVAAGLLLAIFIPRPESQVIEPPSAAPPQIAAATAPQPKTVVEPETRRVIQKGKRRAVPQVPPWGSADPVALLAALDALYEEPRLPSPGAAGQTVLTIQTQDPNVTILMLEESHKSQGDEE